MTTVGVHNMYEWCNIRTNVFLELEGWGANVCLQSYLNTNFIIAIFMQSNKIHKVFVISEFIQHLC